MELRMKRAGMSLSLFLSCILLFTNAFAQTISFTPSTLIGDNLSQPTSLQFGPDGRLYVAEQFGRILAYTVTRNSANSYQITDTEEILLIKQIPNHNDDGTLNSTVNTRQVTGIVVAGTAANPVIYVTSSDPRIGGGSGANNDKNLDTNSGVISRLTWDGSQWVKLDLVRGLPRSEENHSPNGLAYDKVNNVLYMAQGGNTNMGAPSNNFAYLPEYAYSTAILKIDLNAIGNSTYDLPTLDDETRANVSGNDVNDPFGGNDGLNQAKLVAGGPVSIYSPGWRNNYDIVLTQAGKMYSFDNGPNGGWGGPPISCSISNSEPGSTYCDGLHYVSGMGYYAGFPNPVRANRSITFNASNPQTPIPLGMENPAECNYIVPGSNGSLTTICSSTNGMAEYKASNFSNVMKGDLLAVAFNGKLYRFKMNAAGNAIVSGGQTIVASGFGSIPLDVVAQGDNEVFPGTIWVAMYGGNDIVVFEPNDFTSCAGDASSMALDDDGDGYKNGDETQNGTDKCSPASVPADFDHDYTSDLLDTDDDNDGLPDNIDKFAQDADNGTATAIPVLYTYQNTNEGGIGGWGYTGLMTNYTDDYMSLYDMDNMTVGGAAYKFTVDNIPAGDALGALNNQKYAYQLGVNVGSFPFGYVVNGRVMGPFAGLTPTDFRSMGIFMGTGDQDNYLKMVCAANAGAGGIEIVREVAGIATSTMYNIPILGSTHVNLYLQVDPTTQMVQPSYSVGGGARTNLGPQVSVPASWLNSVLAVGFISTSRGATPFSATWDYIAVEPVEGAGNWVNVTTTNTCTARHESAFVQSGNKFYLVGGRGSKPVEIYNYTTKTWSTGATPPIQLHHFQAVELNGLIYVVCAFTGNYPNETPVANAYIYDPVANAWHVGMEIPAARRRGSAGVAVHNGNIYVVSGLTNGHVSGWVPYLDKFNPNTNAWTTLPDAPHSRDHFQVAVHDDRIFAIGGRLSGFGGSTFATTVPETDIYDINNQTWNTLSSPEGDIPTQRAACALAVLGDEILAIGGESMAQTAAHAQTEALNVNTNSWRTLDDLNTGRHGTQAIVNNFGVYIAAGCGNRGGSPELNTIESFYLYGQTVPIGTAYTKGALTYSPSSLSYGQIPLGNSSVKTITVTNPGGTQSLLIKSITLSSAANYSISHPNTLPFVLNAGDTFKIDVTFAPSSVGVKNATLTVGHTGSNGASSVINLTGEGLGSQPTVRINTGGPQYTTAASEVFAADAYYTNYTGSTNSTTQAIAGTTEDALYQTERYGTNFAYNVPVSNGTYTVKLHFAEIWSGGSNTGVRVFDVLMEGATVVDDLDIYATAGMYSAHVRTFTIPVSDQVLNIQFIASVNNAKISAIEIIPATITQGMLTAVPSSLTFPGTTINTASQPIMVTLTNTGVSTLTVNNVTISGTHASNYTHTFSGTASLAAGASTSFTVTFNPSASGMRTATITVSHTGGNPSVTIPLSGNGVSATSGCGYFVEQNGLLVMEVESATSSEPGWTLGTTLANYTGTGYYTWTGPEYLHEKGHGILTYNFKINNPGKYRFKIRTQNSGTLNTHNNDVWVRMPDHGVKFEKNGALVMEKSGWWKEWQSNLNVWTYNTWAGESTYWEVYVEFPFQGVYTIEISGRTKLYSLDRLVLYRPDMMSDWAATGATPPQSAWENCPATPLVWYKDNDRDYYGNPLDSVLSVSKPGVGWSWNKTDCDDVHSSVYPGAPELLDGRDNDCDGVSDEGAYLTALNINCGGSTHNAVNGEVFESDRLYSLPSSAKYYSGIGDILNTDDDALFKSERHTSTSNNLKYNFKAIPGLYTVTFFWAEQNTVMNPGERVFDVYVEDSLVINDLDIIAVAGYKVAYSFTHNLRLTDSTLNVKVVDVIGKAKINALKVSQKPNTPPTFTISGNSTYNEDFAGTNFMNVTPAVVPLHEAYQVVTYSLSPASVPFANISINPGTGQVAITSMPNMNGQQQFTITANDGYGTNNIATKTFTLKVLAVNDAPAFSLSGSINVNEDFGGTQTVSVTPATAPADEASQVVTYSLSPTSVNFATVSINSSTGLVSIVSIPDMSGSQVFTVTANDGQAVNNIASQTFTLTVNAVNDMPTLAAIADVVIDEDTGTQILNISGISAGGNESQALSVALISDNVALISNPSVNYASANASGSISFAPVADKNGVAHITVTVSDGSLSFDRTFTVTVNPVNDAPLFNTSGNISVNEDFASAEVVNVITGIIPADEISQIVSYILSPASVSFANVSINSATGEVSITSVADASGLQVFTVTADDGQSQNNIAMTTFTLTVNAVNDAPVFSLSGDVSVNEDFTTSQHVAVTPAAVPADETSQTVSYSISPASVPFANVSINSATGEVSITSVADAVGSVLFTVTADDAQSQNNLFSQTFTLTVNAVNDAPVFTLSGDISVSEDFVSTQIVSASPAPVPADEASQTVSYSLSPSSVTFANVSINSSTGKVSITSIADASGSQLFTVTANDGEAFNNLYTQTFMLNVNAVNDAPAFVHSGNITVNEDFTTTEIVSMSLIGVPADEAGQTVLYSLSPASVSFADISFNASSGEVTITSIANANGSQLFTVTADDAQSQNNSYLQTFMLTVNAVNDAPSFTLSGDISVIEGIYTSATETVTPAVVPADEMSQTVIYSIAPASIPFANISMNSSTGEVTITPVADQFGSQLFTITANDNQSQNNTYSQTFTLTVEEGNNPPSFRLSGDVTVDEDFAAAQHITVTPDSVRPHEAGQVVTYSLSPASVSFANISFDSNTGEVSITSIPNQYGSQQFTITADDAQSRNNIYSETFMLIVNSVNDAPVFSLSGDVNVMENFATTESVTVSAGFIPANETSQTVSYSLSPASVSFANVSINSATGEVTITKVQDQFGSQLFTVTANDGQMANNTYSQTFTLTVNEGNNAPSFVTSGNVNVDEDFTATQVVTITPDAIRPVDMGQPVTYSLSPASVSFAGISFNSNTGEVSITSVADANGSQQFTITANDGQSVNNLYSQTFTLTVNAVNDAPAFSLSGDIIEDEDFSGTKTVTLSPASVPADEINQSVIYSLFPNTVAFANVSFNSTTGKVNISSVHNASGSQLFTITANDGQIINNSHSAIFMLTINAINDQPTLDVIANQAAVLEDSGIKTINLTGISAGGSENQTLNVSAVSDNPALLAMLSVNYTSPNSTAVLSYLPAPNQWGSATVTVTVNDGQPMNNTISRAFVITVNPVNDAPKFVTNPSFLTLNEDFTGSHTVSVLPSAIPADEVNQTVTYSLSPASVPFANISFNSATGEMQITAIPNMNGSRTLTIFANDGQSQNNTHSEIFVLSVTPVNDAPVFTVNNSVSVFKNFTTTETITVTPAPIPADETFQTVTYSLNPATVSFANMMFNSSNGTVQLTSIANMTGSQTFVITANDGQIINPTHTAQFLFSVIDTNYQPTLDVIANPSTIDEDAAIQTISLSGITPGFNEAQSVTVTAFSNNPALIPNPTVNYVTSSSTGSLSYKSEANQYGLAIITVTVDDGMSVNNTTTRSFTVVVNPVNDEPLLDAIADPAFILEDAGMQSIQLTGISAGPNESQNLIVTTLSSNPSLIANPVVIYNSPDATGVLQYAPIANASGTTVITVIVNDGQTLSNIVSRTFTVTVLPVNDAPVVSDVYKYGQEDKSIGFAASNFIDEYSDIENNAMTQIQIVSLPMNGTLLLNMMPVNVSDEITVADIANLTYDPNDEFSGVDSFLWNGYDAQLYAVNNAKVFINMNNVNDKPFIVSPITDITVNEDAAAMNDYVNLENIFRDIEDGGNMTYTVIVNSNNSLVNATVGTDHTLDISFVANAHGTAMLAVQAKDAAGATIADTFSITVISVEDVPSTFNLLTPTDGSQISNPSAIDFSWESSTDGDDDVVTYAVTIRGYQLDTTISVMSSTSVMFGSSSLFVLDSTYAWFVTASDGDDATQSAVHRFRISVTSVSDPYALVSEVSAYPNPFSTKMRITYSLKTDAKVTLKIFNFLGQEIKTLADEQQTQGEHAAEWNGYDSTSGVYFYELLMETKSGMEGSFIGKIVKE